MPSRGAPPAAWSIPFVAHSLAAASLLTTVLAAADLPLAAAPAAAAARDSTTTVYVARHAEQIRPWPDKNPPLSPLGQRRAEALKHALESAKITAIYSTDLQRARQTAAPP